MTPPNSAIPTAAVLVDDLARYRILPVERVENLLAEFSGGGADALAEFLVRRGAITDFQASRALAGQARALALGPYVLTGVHGRGSLGPVFRGIHRTTREVFAVRVLPLRSLWAARQAKQLAKDLEVLAAHPGVVPLSDADSAHGFHYLVWPLVEADRLGDRVRAAGPLAPPAAARVLAHLADALAACHTRQVVHGMITPLAVALGADDHPKLLDVGAGALLARSIAADEPLFDTLSAAVAVDNELDYAAPEVIADPTRISAGGDLFSFGAVGYFALTGRPPFAEGYVTDRLLAKQIAPPRPVREVNPAVLPELAGIVERLLCLNPAGRQLTADEVRDQLSAVADRLDPTRPVLVRGARLVDAIPADPPPASSAPAGGRGSGATRRWSDDRPTARRIPERDDTDASVRFDLPAPTADDTQGTEVGLPIEPVDTPSRAEHETVIPSPNPAAAVRRPVRFAPPSPPSPVSSPPAELPPTGSAPDLSPAFSDGPTMAKPRLLSAIPVGSGAIPILPLAAADPRLSIPKPVQWHITPPAGTPDARTADLPVAELDAPPSKSVLWRRMRQSLLFWQAPTDPVQVSVFGPTATAPGQSTKLTVFLHTPDALENVRTLSRAFHHDSEPIGTGYVTREVARESSLAVHLALTNAGVSKSLVEFVWHGQPHRMTFDLHVPWESPSGPAPGLVSVGVGNVRIGKIGFQVNVLPRKA